MKAIEFNTKRFCNLLNYELQSNKKQMLTFLGALTGILCMMLLLNLNRWKEVICMDTEDVVVNRMYAEMVFYFIFCGILWSWLGAVRLFFNMRTKQQRSSFLMLPASTFEKYMVRFLQCTVGYFVIWVVAIILADIVQYLVGLNWLVQGHKSVILYSLSEYIPTEMTKLQFASEALLTCFMLSLHAYLTFCASFFRKAQVVFALVFFFIAQYVSSIAHINVFDILESIDNDPVAVVWGYTLMFVLLSVVAYYGSYVVFKRMQVINNNWINI